MNPDHAAITPRPTPRQAGSGALEAPPVETSFRLSFVDQPPAEARRIEPHFVGAAASCRKARWAAVWTFRHRRPGAIGLPRNHERPKVRQIGVAGSIRTLGLGGCAESPSALNGRRLLTAGPCRPWATTPCRSCAMHHRICNQPLARPNDSPLVDLMLACHVSLRPH